MRALAPKTANRLLWTLQCLLAITFLFAGGSKLALPLDALKGPIALPGPFIRFIGVAEVAGALGLILPGLFRVKVQLTWLAAAGLAIIMVGATTLTIVSMGALPSLFPFFVGLAAVAVFHNRRNRLRLRVR